MCLDQVWPIVTNKHLLNEQLKEAMHGTGHRKMIQLPPLASSAHYPILNVSRHTPLALFSKDKSRLLFASLVGSCHLVLLHVLLAPALGTSASIPPAKPPLLSRILDKGYLSHPELCVLLQHALLQHNVSQALRSVNVQNRPPQHTHSRIRESVLGFCFPPSVSPEVRSSKHLK